MGGDDLRRWIEALLEAKLLARGARVLAYSYIGPSITWPIYRTGTIGQAKADLEKTVRALDSRLAEAVGGHAWTSVNAAVVTQASSAIPGVPLYLALIAPVLDKKGLLERPIDQILRLMKVHAGPGRTPSVDAEGRIRMDDWEMRGDVQSVVTKGWNEVTPETLTVRGGSRRLQARVPPPLRVRRAGRRRESACRNRRPARAEGQRLSDDAAEVTVSGFRQAARGWLV